MKRRVRVYAGPSCPQDPSHGPLLEIAGLDELFCPAAAHAVPEGRSFFTQREVLAATPGATPDGSPRDDYTSGAAPAAAVTTPEAAPEVSAPALGRRLPASGVASAAAASSPGRAEGSSAGGRGADELTLRYQFGDK